jgi:hypothetical protein
MLYSTLQVGCDKELTGNPGPTTTEWAHPALHRPGLQPSVNILDHPFRDYLQSNLDSEGVSEWEQGTGIERVGRNVRGINKMLDRLDIVSKCHGSAGTPLGTHAGGETLGLQDARTAIRT